MGREEDSHGVWAAIRIGVELSVPETSVNRYAVAVFTIAEGLEYRFLRSRPRVLGSGSLHSATPGKRVPP
jgi:hypothetical protein